MTSFKTDQIIELKIHGIGSHGEGVGYFEGYTVFIEGALPGETVQARLTKCQKRYGKAELLSIQKASPFRVKPPCPLFEKKCGGCQLMHLSYPQQLEIKRQKVIDALTRIAGLEKVDVEPCLPSPSQLNYRNKIQLPVRKKGNGLALGLYERGSQNLVEVDKCYIHCPSGEAVYQSVRPLIQQSGIEPYDPETGKGQLRHVLIKSALQNSESLIVLVTNTSPSQPLQKLAENIMASNPNIRGVVHNLHAGRDNVILGREYTILKGSGYIEETLSDLTFKISPASFFQVNPAQAVKLYEKALELAELKGHEVVFDAYCGVGTLSLFFARHAKKVIGVECVKEAIVDAKENARLNHITNVHFVAEKSEAYIGTLPHADLILLNPPRKGCDPLFLDGIGRLLPKTLIYISCDPATLARDVAHLATFGYRLEHVQPFDMFPQTAHVECVAKLKVS